MAEGSVRLSSEGITELVEFLKGLGADRVKHSQRTFLEHLVDTAALLARWGATPRACKAGLFHSIYGTEYFKGAVISFDERPRVQALLGEEAERLAYIFCAFDRASIYRAIERGAPYTLKLLKGGEVTVSPGELKDLVNVVWANALEQAPHARLSDESKARSRQSIKKTLPFLSDLARRDLEAFYGPVSAPLGDPMSKPGLRALFNLDDPKKFLETSWPDKMFTAKGPVERLAGLIDHDFDTLVKMKKHHTKAFFRTLDGASTSITVTPGQERQLYEAGFTIYFHNITAPPLAQWVDALDEELGLVHGVTRVSAFASRRGAGLLPHYDMNDNFVCQARGTKRWRIWPNTHVTNPTAGYTIGNKLLPVHQVEAPNGMPKEMTPNPEVVELTPGMVVFMPRGMWHDTQTVEQESLHFNIQSGLAMWKDAIEYVLTRTSLLHHEELREPIMRMFDGEKLRAGVSDELKEKLRAVVEAVCESDIEINRPAFHKFVMSRRPKNN